MNRQETLAAHQARLDKYGSTLDEQNAASVVARIADYPEIIEAVHALDAALTAQEGERGGAVEYRVNMTEDRGSWQDCYYIPCDSLELAMKLCRDAREWPNGKHRRWPETRICGPWEPVRDRTTGQAT